MFLLHNFKVQKDDRLNSIHFFIMKTIDDQIRDKKLQYDINGVTAKISALSSGKIDKYGYFTGDEILPSNQKRITGQAEFNYSSLGKAFEEWRKTIADQGQKQIKAIRDNKEQLTDNIADDYKNELLISKERNVLKNNYNARLDKEEELTKT